MRDAFLYGSLLILVAGGGSLFGYGIYKEFFQPKAVTVKPPSDGMAELRAVQKLDEKLLDSGNADDEEIVKILKRYSLQKHDGTKDLVQRYLRHPKPAVRAAALEAAGSVEGHVFAREIDNALLAGSPEMRLAALRALVRGPRAESDVLVRQVIARADLSDRERFQARIAYLKVAREEAEKARMVREILDSPPESQQVRSETYIELFQFRQGDPEVVKLAQLEIRTPVDTETAIAALEYLANFAPSWLDDNIAELPMQNQYRYQAAVVEHLARRCGKGWSALASKLRATDPALRKLISEVQLERRCTMSH